MLGKNKKKRFKNFGISDEEFINHMKGTQFLASHNQAWLYLASFNVILPNESR